MRNEPKKKKKKKNRTSKKVELQNTPTDCVIAIAQRCFGAKMNSPRKFALVSCFELPQQTQNELRFGLILFEMTSYQFVLRFRLKYIGAFIHERCSNGTLVCTYANIRRYICTWGKMHRYIACDVSLSLRYLTLQPPLYNFFFKR